MFSSLSTLTISWAFTEDLGQGHVKAVGKPELKSVGFIVCQPDCRTTYLQVETTSELSIVTGGALVRNDDVSTKVGVGGGGEIKVNEVEIQRPTHC